MHRPVCVICILAILWTLNATAESVAIPDTNAGKKLSTWLDVFSRGDQDAFVQYIEANYSKELLKETSAVDRADGQARTYLDARSFVIRSIEETTPQEISVLAQAALTGLWFRLTMKIDESASHAITEYKSQRIPTPQQFASGKKLTDEELAAETKDFINKLVAADAFSGTIMLARDGANPFFRLRMGWPARPSTFLSGWIQS